ncbi:hypothetical protein C8R48DRAFT_774923 [Suillus tomentosus]|nr:hypothetical protein C8R48DRAFT_774923 [Suillus tomentosus]
MSHFPDDSERYGDREGDSHWQNTYLTQSNRSGMMDSTTAPPGMIYPFQPHLFGSLDREVEQTRNTLQGVMPPPPPNSEKPRNNLDPVIHSSSNDEFSRVCQNASVIQPIKRDLTTHGIFASLRRSSSYPNSFYSEPTNLPAPSVPAVNWVDGLFDHFPSEPEGKYQEAGPSRILPDPIITPRLTFDDETAYTRLSTARASSRPVRRTKPPYERPSRLDPPRRNPNHWGNDIIEAMRCSIFNGTFLPKPDELAEMARRSFDSSSGNSTQWVMTVEGLAGVVKISEVLTNLRDDIKVLTRAWVVPGYQIPLYTQTAPMIQLFVDELVKEYRYLKGDINVRGTMVNLPFGHQAIIGFVKHLLFHDRQYWRYLSPTKNLGPLLAYTSTLHTWALDEMSTGRFCPLEFDVITKQSTYNAFVQLFETLTDEERIALNTYIMAQA